MLRKLLLPLCGTLLFLAACVVPEKFVAEYEIKPNGDYALTYEGTMVNVFSRMVELEAKEKKRVPDAKAEKDIQAVRDGFKKDPRVKNFKEEAADIYRVRMEETGNLKEKRVLPFYSKDFQVWSLQYDPKANTVTFSIALAKGNFLSDMEKLNISPDGEIKISTDCKIASSNVKLDKSFFGNTYSIRVKKETLREGVKIVLQL